LKIDFLHRQFISFLVIGILFLPGSLFAQWVNDPTANTRLVTDPVDPINISAVRDLNGGAFIFWQDKKINLNSDVYFLHFNKNGEVSFRSDGKSVTTNNYQKENPVAAIDPAGNAIVIWKENDDKRNTDLYIQKLTRTGLRLWNTTGISLTNSKSEKIDYDMQIDRSGTSFISYTIRTAQSSNKYSVRYQKINTNGKLLSDSSKGIVVASDNKVSETKVIPDNKGGLFVCWLENINNKTALRTQYIDSTGSKKWGSKPVTISKKNTAVIGYSVGKIGSYLYAAVNYQGTNKSVYHQLISDKGKLLWGTDGKLLTYQKGSQTNPQIVFVDSSIVVSWTNEFEKIKDVFIQRFDLKGQSLWGNNGKRIINIKGNQFGQRLINDNKGNIIIAWVDKRDDVSSADLYIQKIDLSGKIIWNSDGVKISSTKNMLKSYLNLIPDNEGGAIAVFKGTSDGKNDIFGQKIFNTGTYASQVLGFNAELVGDSVLISWYAANESDGTNYVIEKSTNGNSDSKDWQVVANISKGNKKQTNLYEYADFPNSSGSIYYRVVQNNSKSKTLTSVPVKVDYFTNSDKIILAQNSPNPFSESTTITFYLPEEEDVTLEIFNSNIETIQKIENKKFSAGKNSYVFNANGLKPGIYFYRLKVDDFVDVKKMIITQ
jgi:hypothetical protein